MSPMFYGKVSSAMFCVRYFQSEAFSAPNIDLSHVTSLSLVFGKEMSAEVLVRNRGFGEIITKEKGTILDGVSRSLHTLVLDAGNVRVPGLFSAIIVGRLVK